jgi:uncharacterized protein YdgA (DUF945 family)
MNRWLVVLLVVLALVILVSPGIIGRLAEQNIEDNIEWAESEGTGVNITTERFDRGWFTSEGQHRVVLEGGPFRDAIDKYAAATGNADLPSLIIDTRIDHGLVPVTSLSRDSGSLAPGLASTLSTFQLDPGNGELVALPGTLFSEVSLSGASDSRFTLETGSFEHEEVMVNWEGADVSVYSDRSSGEISVHGTIEPFRLTGDDGDAHFGNIRIDADQMRTDYGFNVGPAAFNISEITINDNGQQLAFGGMDVEGDSSVENGRFSGGGTVSIGTFGVPGFGDVSMDMDISMDRFQAEPLGAIIASMREAQSAPDPDLAMQMLLPTIEGDLQALLTAGAEFRLDKLDITLPQGTVQAQIVVDIAATDSSANFSWPGVLLAMTANVDLRVPAALFDLAAMMNPQAGSLIAMGILQQEGDDYVMQAEYAQGLVNVNGAPMPIPIPGLSP